VTAERRFNPMVKDPIREFLIQYLGPLGFIVEIVMLTLTWVGFLLCMPIVGLSLCALTGTVSGLCARRKNRNPYWWGILGGVFWGIALPVLAFLPKRPVSRPNQTQTVDSPRQQHGERPKSGNKSGDTQLIS
jgi:hypothetical protein